MILAVLCATAHGQRAIVAATALSSTREAARVYVHSVDMGRGAPLPGAQALPGSPALGPLLLTADGHDAILSSANLGEGRGVDEWSDETFLSRFRVAPFARATESSWRSSPSWRQWAACVVDLPARPAGAVVVLGVRQDESGIEQGAVSALFLGESSWEQGPSLPLDGPPVDAAPIPQPGDAASGTPPAAAILCRVTAGASVSLLDVMAGTIRRGDVTGVVSSSGIDAAPSGVAVSRNGAWIFVLLSGYAWDRPGGEAVSWLHVLATESLEPACAPAEFPGAARAEDHPLRIVDEHRCWVATRVPGTDFAHVARVGLASASPLGPGVALVKEIDCALTGVPDHVCVAPAPHSLDVAVSAGSRLAIWPNGQRDSVEGSYGDAIQVLRWTPQGLLAGEGGRVHVVDVSTARPLRTVQLQSGWVTDLAWVPPDMLPTNDADADGLTGEEESRRGTAPHRPDTDGDGIPDGSDPEPLAPSPCLGPLDGITFHGDAVGHEVRVLALRPQALETAVWRITYDEAAMPWLRLHPQSGRGPKVVSMGVDPARYVPGEPLSGVIRVDMGGTGSGTEAAGSPAVAVVRVAPEHGPIRTVLWLWAEESAAPLRAAADPHGLSALAGILAGPPQHLSHRETRGAFQGSLDPYVAVVLDAAVAAQGAITRQAVLEYVARGGALLFLGGYLGTASSPVLAQWLSPLGIRIDTGIQVGGQFAGAGAGAPLRYWKDFLIQNGCAIEAEQGNSSEPGGTAIVVREYGLGRIALLAGRTPLENSALQREPERRFALELFRWLSRARIEFTDRDGDGLADGTEDANNNGARDPGETDYEDADTDSDGIADGKEDLNRNGVVDEGESDPRNGDSDGDGILDGADTSPCAEVGTPYVASVEPHEGPAEGGTAVLIRGRNLAPGSTFWFGKRKAPWAKTGNAQLAVVRTPDLGQDQGGDVPVRVESPGTGLTGTLPAGFHYGPRSLVRLVLEPAGPGQWEADDWDGALAVRLDAPGEVAVEALYFVVEAAPVEGLTWGNPHAAVPTQQGGSECFSRVMEDGTLVTALTPGKRGRLYSGILIQVPWRRSGPEEPGVPVRMRVSRSLARARHGGILAVRAEPLVWGAEAPAPSAQPQ